MRVLPRAPGKICPALTYRQGPGWTVAGEADSVPPWTLNAMKINGPNSASTVSGARAKGAASAGGFSLALGETGSTAGAAPASAAAGVSSVGALLALQEAEDPMNRRRRAVSRAGRILDALDELKLGVLEGQVSAGRLQGLVAAVREERASADDLRLQGLLNEIETRAAVELAKLGRSFAA